MHTIRCNYETHGGEILAILNEAILNSTALYDYRSRTAESIADWFQAKQAGDFPVLGAVDGAGRLLGFASYGSFRALPANKYTVEHAVYVHPNHRGQGIALTLMRQLITLAAEQQYHTLIGAIDAGNAASIALHGKLGFVHAGTLRQAGFKFQRWLDLAFYQLLLKGPERPVDG